MSVTVNGQTFHYLKLRHGRRGGIDVMGYGTYPRNSVLAGQTSKHWLDNLDTEAEARAKYPQAEGFSNAWTEPQVNLNHLPGENDPVPGGMYPDDYDDDRYDRGDWSR